MRLSDMRIIGLSGTGVTRLGVAVPRLCVVALGACLAALAAAVPAMAQKTAGPPQSTPFKDTSMIKPPAGAKVAIYEFEDLECPACAHAHPIVLSAVDHYKIPFIRRDFPLGGMHIWSTDAAIWARYMQDKISPKFADDYRTAVFASQTAIASRDDLLNFTRKFLQQHGQQMPFVVDPTGQFRKEVFDDKAIGDKMGLSQTPTIFVCTPTNWVLVTEPSLLYQTIEQLEAQTGAKSAAPVKKASR
jgi:protein-disulfide isomerase